VEEVSKQNSSRKEKINRFHIKNTKRSQMNDLMLHLKLLEQEQAKHKISKRKEIIK
jgi:hypothetical protein